MLKLADLAVRGEDEQPPKVTIHLPPTPVTEVPPVLLPPTPMQPVAKPIVKPKIAVKNALWKDGVLVPMTPLANSPKIRLSSNVSFVEPVAPTVPPPTGKPQLVLKPAPSKLNQVIKKKEKPLPKAQSGGMNANDLKACRSALKKLIISKHSVLFRQPVDPVRDKASECVHIILIESLLMSFPVISTSLEIQLTLLPWAQNWKMAVILIVTNLKRTSI